MFTGDFVTRDGLIPILVVLQECQYRISIEFERNSCKEPTVVINREPKQRHDYDLNSLRHFCRLGISLFFFHEATASDSFTDYFIVVLRRTGFVTTQCCDLRNKSSFYYIINTVVTAIWCNYRSTVIVVRLTFLYEFFSFNLRNVY